MAAKSIKVGTTRLPAKSIKVVAMSHGPKSIKVTNWAGCKKYKGRDDESACEMCKGLGHEYKGRILGSGRQKCKGLTNHSHRR